MRSLPGVAATGPGREKAPPRWGRRGLCIREIADLFFEGLYFVY